MLICAHTNVRTQRDLAGGGVTGQNSFPAGVVGGAVQRNNVSRLVTAVRDKRNQHHDCTTISDIAGAESSLIAVKLSDLPRSYFVRAKGYLCANLKWIIICFIERVCLVLSCYKCILYTIIEYDAKLSILDSSCHLYKLNCQYYKLRRVMSSSFENRES